MSACELISLQYPDTLNRETRFEPFLMDDTLCPDERLLGVVVVGDEAFDVGNQFRHALERRPLSDCSATIENPLDFQLISGQVSDTARFEISLDLGSDSAPRMATTGKRSDSKPNRMAARKRGITPVIPCKVKSKKRRRFSPRNLYKLWARAERATGKLKRFKRIALRCDKTAMAYGAFISFGGASMLDQSVHKA